ncbi:YebO family protein [Pectobacteriaceae bacterium CE90]|nr:YebO family protein [Prodigiosinella sp. LS101]WJV55732.1 YebO family protein [Prodigiosinella sp. LS101]WJV60094.1 YebO family protein [Pectobacteriaceae bacterium C111]WJY13205.1 YebO family protein [Pectobacteriaceae bacterium CE90]
MSEVASSSLGGIFVVLVMLLIMFIWFFINRISVRANEQIRLLQEIVEQQKLQSDLLQTLVKAVGRDQGNTPSDSEYHADEDIYFKDVIPER